MELKYQGALEILEDVMVLIIPYGIEIRLKAVGGNKERVLIIPYGIEIYYSPVAGPY